jgi:hypothetical protein
MKEMSLVLVLQRAADMVYVASNVSMILVHVKLGFTDNNRHNLLYWATLMSVDRALAYRTPCVSVAVVKRYDLFYCVTEVNE